MGHMVRGRGRHPIAADRCRAPGAMPEEPRRAPTGKGRVCTAATPSSAPSPGAIGAPTSPIVPETSAIPAGPTSPSTAVRGEYADAFPAQGPGPASTAPSPTNHRRTTAFVEGRMRRPGAFRASRRRPVESGKRRRRPAEATDHFETRRKPKSRNARRRLTAAGNQVGRQRRPPVRTGPVRPIGSGAHSGPSPPTGERARVRSLPSMRAGGRIAERIACRSGDPDRQPISHVRRHPRPQPHPRAPDPNRCPRPRHAPEACRAAALPGNGNPSSHPVRRTGRIIRPGGKPILPMNGDDSLEGELRHALTTLNAAARSTQACTGLCNNRVTSTGQAETWAANWAK